MTKQSARSRCLGVLAAAIGIFVVSAGVSWQAAAQTVPDNVKQALIQQAWGRGGPTNQQIYDQALTAAPKAGIKVTKELAYGKHAKQKVDVYQPEGKSNLPILVFVHGGGYTGGARDTNPLVHANILTYFARNGFLGVNAGYRLAPEVTWPAGGDDMREIVRWLKENAAKHGGDPNRIYLFGQSAGANHVATYVFDRRIQPDSGPGIAGAILMSGRYVFHHDPDYRGFRGAEGYLGTDPKAYVSRSATTHVNELSVPVMLVMSEFDQLNLASTTGDLFTALCYKDGGRCPRLLQLKYHNHSSQTYHFNSADDYLGKEIIEWIHEGFGATRKVPATNGPP